MSSDKYPIVYLPLAQLEWKWYWPPLRTKSMDLEESYNIKKHILMKQCLMNPNWRPRNKKSELLLRIFESIKSDGLINPLIVGAYRDKYIVIVGNQRLSCLKALNELGILKSNQIMCREEPDQKYWDTDWPKVRLAHPYS